MNYTTLASTETIARTMEPLKERGVLPELVETRVDALDRNKALIPAGASVMNGSSRTLEEIGFVDYLKSGEHS